MIRVAAALSTLCGLGTHSRMPGTLGSIAALPFAWLLLRTGGALGLLIATCVVSLAGWWASAVYVRKTGRKDPKEVIIDEVAGQWLTVLLFLYLLPFGTLPGPALYALAFAGFRAADILKPWPVSWLDRTVPGGLGVMLDDLAAALWIAGFTTLCCLGLDYVF